MPASSWYGRELPASIASQVPLGTGGFQVRPAPLAVAARGRNTPNDRFNGFSVGLVAVVPGRPLFADGFEIGDTSAWSLTVP